MGLQKDDIVQLDPEHHTHHDGFWAGALLVVTEVKSWGVQGYVRVPDGAAHYRAKNGTFEHVGHLAFVPERGE